MSNNIDKQRDVHLPQLPATTVPANYSTVPQFPEREIERKKSKKKKRESLPTLNNTTGTSDISSLSIIGKSINRTAWTLGGSNNGSTSSEASSKSQRSAKSVRLVDSLSYGRPNSQTGRISPRTFGDLVIRENGGVIGKTSNLLPPMDKPQRAKSATDVRNDDEPIILKATPIKLSNSTNSLRTTVERSTQTQMNLSHSASALEYLGRIAVRSTQTDPVPIHIYMRGKSQMSYESVHDNGRSSRVESGHLLQMDEKGALLDIIEDALDETIDKYSRQRTNQIIAQSARKQAQIWRDAKDFIAGCLLPQAIQAANKSKRRQQTATEIVRNIKMYP